MRKEQYRSFLSEEEYKFLSLLVEISEDADKVVKCNNFDDEEYIYFDGENFVYRTTDDILISDEAIEVVEFFRSSYSIGWYKSCRWYIDDMPN